MQRSRGEKAGNALIYAFLTLFTILILVPVIYILRQSVDVGAYKGGISLWPDKFSWAYYKMVLSNSSIYMPLKNTVIITVLGTALSVAVNATAAYPLYRTDYRPRKFLVYYMVIIPMLFSGGMIPTYLLMKRLNLLNTLAVCIIPYVASGWNIVLIRNYYNSIPRALTEAARIDGASEFLVYTRIMLPLSKAVLAAVALFAGIGFWNTFTPSLYYNTVPTKYTFAVKLREMIFAQEDMSRQFEAMMNNMSLSSSMGDSMTTEGVASAMMIISIVPILVVYPLLQKHFASGILVGSVKG